MAHSDFTAAKYRAVYCGSMPKIKPGYVSLRNSTIDTNLQLCGNRWGAADTAAIQSTLSIQMKRSYVWGGNGDDFQADILPPPLDLEGIKDYSVTEKNTPRLRSTSPTPRSHREKDVDSAALETIRLKDKVKRKVSEGFGTKGAPVDLMASLNTPLKPAVCKSASQRTLNATKPVPPIQRSPLNSPSPQIFSSMESRPQRSGADITDGMIEQDNQSPAAELQNVRYSTEKKRNSVIPPILKASVITPELRQQETTLTSSADLLARRSPDFKEGASEETSRRDSKNEKLAMSMENQYLKNACHQEPANEIAMKKTECSTECDQLMDNLPGSGNDMEVVDLTQLSEEGKENNGRINFTISKSAQDKMRQKQLEFETIRQERRRSQQHIWEKLQTMDSGDPAALTSFRLSGVSTVPVISDTRRVSGPNNPLNKWGSRPSLPSINTLNQDSTLNDFRFSSAYSLPANFLNNTDWDSDSDNGGPVIGPMSHPEQGMLEALKWLNHKEWEQKEKGLLSVRCLASCHPEVLFSRLHDVSIAVTREVGNLRSKVSRHAIKTLGDLFKSIKKGMDQEVEEITRVLLHKIGDSNDFIREESDKVLGVMVENVSPSKALVALIVSGVSHRNTSVRKCSAKYLLDVVEQLGSDRLLCGNKESTDTLLRSVVKLAQDGQQDTRFYGRRMFSLLMTHPKFEGHLERLIPSHDLRGLIATVKQKEASDNLSDVPSARKHRTIQLSGAPPAQESPISSTSDQCSAKEPDVESDSQESSVHRRQPVRAAEVTEQLKELNKLLTAKEYQSKMSGVTMLLEHCRNNVKFVSANITQIFDSFNPRLQDANKKVNQYALESAVVMIPLLKESLHQVLLPMVTVVTDNLNSKHSGIYAAAVKVVDTLFSNIDHLWLLQPFASRVRFISGRAMNDVTERLSVLVSSVYPRKPQAVERHILPVLWYFLSNITGNGVLPGRNGNFKDVVCKLAKNLHKVMGPYLEEYAAGQPQHAIKMLRDLLDLKQD
ncbi:TOG array regulator of axonemal microtubules 2 isoform X6 [Pelobates cultripes]|uniref:TOG array regulator of axonemal microtubules 2 isoform X6 n=1 Tax=Pelobates cultripes TaxID=61616 RepID=A0AAD1RHR7_PELCU|nr:TOG array regulator of axonemal microtubules 2 isoform X6 [Pelobates cultripes]